MKMMTFDNWEVAEKKGSEEADEYITKIMIMSLIMIRVNFVKYLR